MTEVQLEIISQLLTQCRVSLIIMSSDIAVHSNSSSPIVCRTVPPIPHRKSAACANYISTWRVAELTCYSYCSLEAMYSRCTFIVDDSVQSEHARFTNHVSRRPSQPFVGTVYKSTRTVCTVKCQHCLQVNKCCDAAYPLRPRMPV